MFDFFKFYRDFVPMDDEIYLDLYGTSSADKKRGFVPCYFYYIKDQRTNLAMGEVSFRVGYNQNTYYGGNIGYEVYEKYRGRHYALKSCRALIPLAKKHRMDKLIITTNPDNAPSRRTCELLGAQLVETVDVPQSLELYLLGARQKCIYILPLDFQSVMDRTIKEI